MVHDLSFVYFSQYTHPKDLPYKRKFVPPSIKRAQRIVTISKSSQQQIEDYYGVESKRISVVYPAVDTTFFSKRSRGDIGLATKRYRLPERYILYTGTLEPRKNITGLLNAYANLDSKLQREYALVLAGGKGWQDEAILAKIKILKSQGLKIVTTGYVPDADLPAIYSGASLFVFPSFYEGFGIPPLEAMACSVPVISANNSSLPEAVGKAGIMVTAGKSADLVVAIEKILSDVNLQQQLIKRGHEQVQKYTWSKAAEQLADAINKV